VQKQEKVRRVKSFFMRMALMVKEKYENLNRRQVNIEERSFLMMNGKGLSVFQTS
jgi:hypothetical protein